MAPTKNTKKTLPSSRFYIDGSYENGLAADIPVNSSDDSLVKAVWRKPLGKAIVISGVSIILIGGSGYLFRLLAWWRLGYLQFKAAGSPSDSINSKL